MKILQAGEKFLIAAAMTLQIGSEMSGVSSEVNSRLLTVTAPLLIRKIICM